MCRPTFIHAVCLQPPCASSCSLAWTDIVFRDRKDRSERVLCVGLASLVRMTGTKAKRSSQIPYSRVGLRASMGFSASTFCSSRAC